MSVKYYWDVIQKSDEWLSLRLGMLTASEMKNFITPSKLEISKSAAIDGHINQLAYERITGYIDPHFQSADMQRGEVEEVYAKDLYSKNYNQVKDCGFIVNDSLGFCVGYSPDGIIGDDGLIECKSRKGNLQFQTILAEKMPNDYFLQIQTGLFVSGRKWCDFVSYGNGMPMFVERVFPDEKAQSVIAEAAQKADDKIGAVIERYKEIIAKRNLVIAPRRDPDEGTIIKPAENLNGDSVALTQFLNA